MDSKEASCGDEAQQGVVSFAFQKSSKKWEKALVPSSREHFTDEESGSESDAIQRETISNTTELARKKEKFVIPLIKENRWKSAEKRTAPEADDTELAAKRALLDDAVKFASDSTNGHDANVAEDDIPLILQNQVPGGLEGGLTIDVLLRPDEPTEADYDTVPIEEYGLAMLRGMGWKEGRAIGLNQEKKAVHCVEPQLRPKGLGLGAVPIATSKGQVEGSGGENRGSNEKLTLRKGAYVKIMNGALRDSYGMIESFDSDNARVIVKLAIGGKSATVSMHNVQLITKVEFDKEGKCLNSAKYEKYKRETSEKLEKMRGTSRRVEASEPALSHQSQSGESNDDVDDVVVVAKKPRLGHQKAARSWLNTDLRVRIVDKYYKNGKYYKEKVTIEDVPDLRVCNCRTDRGELLEGITQDMLETVIPRSEPAYVQIIEGKYMGEFGIIQKRDREKGFAIVQLLRRREKALKLDFNEICQYIGDVSYMED